MSNWATKRNFASQSSPRRKLHRKDNNGEQVEKACAYLRSYLEDVTVENALVRAVDLLASWKTFEAQIDVEPMYKAIHALIIAGKTDLCAKNNFYMRNNEDTALHIAVKNDLETIIPMLITGMLTAGCDIDTEDQYEQSPLYYAVSGRFAASVRLLVLAGAQVDKLLTNAREPLMGCCDKNVITALIAGGLDLNKSYGQMFLPLHWAAGDSGSWDWCNLIDFLIESGADVDARAACLSDFDEDEIDGGYSQTALMQAALHSNADIAETLIVAGADVDAVDARGYNACYLADNHHLVLLLVAAGTDLRLLADICSANVPPANYMEEEAKGPEIGDDPSRWNVESGEILMAAGLRSNDILPFCRSTPREDRLSDIFGFGNVACDDLLEDGDNMDGLSSGISSADILSEMLPEMLSEMLADYWRKQICDMRKHLAVRIFKRVAPLAFKVCCALQELQLPALVTLCIVDALLETKNASYHLVPMHVMWKMITAVKHFEPS
jgi:hypothetical protein